MSSCKTYYAAVLIDHITSPVRPMWAPNLKTKRHRKTKINVNARSNLSANFQLIRSKV